MTVVLFWVFRNKKSTKNTIQYVIENALHSLQIDSGIIASGRTDAGVHASGQVIHFDLPIFWTDLSKLKLALNQKTQRSTIQTYHTSISLIFMLDFRLRRDFTVMFSKQTGSLSFEQKYISQYQTFNTELLQEALTLFEGKHDF